MAKGKILVVGIADSDTHSLVAGLAAQGYDVEQPPDLPTLLKQAPPRSPTVLLVAPSLSALRRGELGRSLPLMPPWQQIPVLVLESDADLRDLAETRDRIRLVLAAGGADYIAKPYSLEQVMARIEPHLHIQRLQQQLDEHTSQAQPALSPNELSLPQSSPPVLPLPAFNSVKHFRRLSITDFTLVLVDIQRQLLAPHQQGQHYGHILQLLGQATGASCVHLYETHRNQTGDLLIHHGARWCDKYSAVRRGPLLAEGASLNEVFPRWADALSAGNNINGLTINFPAAERAVLESQGIQSILALPLIVFQELWGVIQFIQYTEARVWELPEVSLLSAATSAISLHRERQQVENALREGVKRERAVRNVVEQMRQTLDIEHIFRTTTQELRQLLACDRVAIYRFNPDWSGYFVAESVAAGWASLIPADGDKYPLSKDTIESDRCIVKSWHSPADTIHDTYLQEQHGGAYRLRRGFSAISNIDDANFDPCYVKLLRKFQARAYLTVPIFLGTRLWGLLASYQNSGPRTWHIVDINLANHISSQLGIALHQTELFVQTQQQSIELQRANAAAEAASRAKSEFLANMSHELRTPLNAILGFAQIMSHDETLEAEHREHLAIISRCGHHLLQLINDVLEMSKIEAGRVKLHQSNVDLYDLLDNLESMLKLKAQEKGLTMSFERAPDVPQWIATDENRLRQVLLNLVGNAIKFTHQGYVRLSVTMKHISREPAPVTDDGSFSLQFAIQDTGIGMAPEDVARLFQPFVQTESGQQSQEGTGLGLVISRKFVKLMGGDISVESAVGQGATFRFSIQTFRAIAIAPPSPRSGRQILHVAPAQPPHKVLIVEDQWENRQVLARLLSRAGFEVQEAEHGADAIARWQKWQPSLILMDMRMPVMDGFEATRRIKATHQGQSTKILALTASVFEETRSAVFEAGCDDFILKPVEEQTLLQKLADHLTIHYVYADDAQREGDRPLSLVCHDSHELESLLDQMPSDWRNVLYWAAIKGSDRQIAQLIQAIPDEHSALAATLKHWNDNFRFDQIIDLVINGTGAA